MRRVAALLIATLAGVGAWAALQFERGPDIDALKALYRRPAAIPAPAANPLTAAKAELGRSLFFDPRLSGGNRHSCASCHNPALGWEDGRSLALGEPGTPLARHTPTLWNLAWDETFFWDGRADSLEAQALGPIQAPLEMNQPMQPLVAELQAIAGYRPLFEAAFGSPEVNAERIVQALASFQRTLVSPQTPFDRWLLGEANAISEAAVRGFVLFNSEARCAQCHTGWAFTDRAFHDIGLPGDDLGRGAVLGLAAVNRAFKTPTLRDLGDRAPYMHDGSLATLEAVMEHYQSGFIDRPTLSEDMQRIELSDQQQQDLLVFLATLDSDALPAIAAAPELPQ